MVQFTPIVEFSSQETKSVYMPGLTYTVRPDNDRLGSLVERWLAEGKVRLLSLPTSAQVAQVGGNGAVQARGGT